MQTTITLDAQEVRRVLAELKKIDPESVKALRKNLRTNLKPIAEQIARNVPATPPASGFNHGGPTAWSRVRASVNFRTGKSRAGGPWTPLLSLQVGTSPSSLRGVYIAELAGSRTNGVTPQGKQLVSVLNSRQAMKGRGGRYIYDKFRLLRPDVVARATKILEAAWKEFDRKLR